MYFRNLTFFRFPPIDRLVLLHLNERLGEHATRPVGPSELSSRGWTSPTGASTGSVDDLVHYVGNALWITLGGEDRILPAAAVNRELEKRLAEIEEREGRKLGGRARKRLKEDVVAELLPRALVKPYRLNAYLDLKRGFLAVDTASRKAAESLVSHLRIALGSFPALPLNSEVAVRATLTSWLAGEPLPTGLVLGDEAELRDPVDGGGVARISRSELQTDEVRHHLEAGKQCTRLALVLGDHVSFTLGEDLVLRKVKFLDGAVEAEVEAEDLAAEVDARFALMAGEVGRLFDLLERALQFSKAEG